MFQILCTWHNVDVLVVGITFGLGGALCISGQLFDSYPQGFYSFEMVPVVPSNVG